MERAFCPRTRAAFSLFTHNRIYMGGPVGPHWITVHDHPVAHAEEMLPGMFVGGCLANAHAQVADGLAAADDTWFFHGYAAWPLSRLQKEVVDGKWSVVEAPATHLLELAKSKQGVEYLEAVRAAAKA